MYGEILDFQSISDCNIKYPIGKSFFSVNLKLFSATVANADIGSLKSFHTLFDKYLDHMLMKSEQNCMGQTTRNFKLFDKKQTKKQTKQKQTNKQTNTQTNKQTGFLKPFLTKRWCHFGRRFCS